MNFRMVLAFFLINSIAAAQTATRPIAKLGSPSDTLRTFFHAAAAGDAEQMREASMPSDALDKIIRVNTAYVHSLQKMNIAMRERFGLETEDLVYLPPPEYVSAWNPPEKVEINGDEADMIVGDPKDHPLKFKFHRIDGKWKMKEIVGPGDGLSWMERMANAAETMAQNIQSGKYADDAAAREAWGKLQPLPIELVPATAPIAPTTQP